MKGQSPLASAQRQNLRPQDKTESRFGYKAGGGGRQVASKERGPTNTSQDLKTTQRVETNSALPAEEHIPMNGYNARAVETAMKAPAEPRPSIYKPAEKPQSGGRSSSAPWGSKRMTCKL